MLERLRIFLFFVGSFSTSLVFSRLHDDTSCSTLQASSEVGRALLQHRAKGFQLEETRHPLFYGICIGLKCAKGANSNFRVWLLSLYQLGGWKGKTVIATDRPTCIRKVVNDVLGIVLGASVYVKELTAKSNRLDERHIKTQKMRAWKNVKSAGVDISLVSAIVYADMDIVFGKPLDTFLHTVDALVSQQDKSGITLAIFNENGLCCSLRKYGGGNTRAYEFHTGVVVMFPNKKAKKCLGAWGAKLLKPLSLLKTGHGRGIDQQALMASTKKCSGIHFLEKDFILFPSRDSVAKKRTAEFLHFTTLRYHAFSQTQLLQYLKHVGVPLDDDAFSFLC